MCVCVPVDIGMYVSIFCRLFDPYTLEYVTTLPKPHHLGITITAFDSDEQQPKESHKTKTEDPTIFPDTVAIGIDVEQNRVRLAVIVICTSGWYESGNVM